jgi:hypothetical protein
MMDAIRMAHRTLVLRPQPPLGENDAAQRLVMRLTAEPGVLSVRIDTLPFCVSLRYDPEVADEAALRARVLYDGMEVGGSESALRMQVALGSLLPKAARALASVL